MAYAAVISLQHTIDHLVNCPRISINPPSAKIIILAFEVQSLQQTLKKLDSSINCKRVNAFFDAKTREAVRKFEDVIESHVTNQFLLQSDSHPLLFSVDFQELQKDLDSFIQSVKKMTKAYIHELCNQEKEEEEDHVFPSRINHFGGVVSNKMVGLSDQFAKIKNRLTEKVSSSFARNFVSLYGMAGIGKTTLANKLFQDPLFSSYSRRAFVAIGRDYKLENILEDILAKVHPNKAYKFITKGDERLADLKRVVYKSLNGWRYFIVLDDVWDTAILADLECLFPDDRNRSVVMLTTRLQKVAEFVGTPSDSYEVRFLTKEESWLLLREKVFVEEPCPPQLQKVGRKIAEICEGLPLLIITVAKLLYQGEKTLEYWNKVAEKENSVFVDANDQISEVLYPSYEYLDEHFKACFLYMGAFPQSYKIPHSKLVNLWSVDGFLEPHSSKSLEDYATECLSELFSQSVVVVHERSYRGRIKTCYLHSGFWHLCKKEAEKIMFFRILNIYADGLREGIKSQRRLSIHNNVLFGIKDVIDSIEENCASTARSLLCFGPHHKYPVPICSGLRLLRVLDALTIRFYEFQMEVLNLVQLRYFTLTYDGSNLPPSISKLWNLQFLIVGRYQSIKSSTTSYLPIEIWDMKELKHLQIMGRNLLDPPEGSFLPNMLTLLDVGAHSCTKGVLQGLPNLVKLRIQIELAPDVLEPSRCFDHISHLHKLETLQYIVVNPRLGSSEVTAPPPPLLMFSSCLQKLTLSGCGYPWDEMSNIASLPNLQVLKLQNYAFRGPKWETRDKGFLQLEYLIIEDTDLVEWRVRMGSFRKLRFLSVKHCYKLQVIDKELGDNNNKLDSMVRLDRIELVDCNPLVVACAKKLAEDYTSSGDGDYLRVNVLSSWDDGMPN